MVGMKGPKPRASFKHEWGTVHVEHHTRAASCGLELAPTQRQPVIESCKEMVSSSGLQHRWREHELEGQLIVGAVASHDHVDDHHGASLPDEVHGRRDLRLVYLNLQDLQICEA